MTTVNTFAPAIQEYSSQIESLKKDVTNTKLSADIRRSLMMDLQEKMAMRQQLINLVSSLMQKEHDMNMAIIRNIGK